MVSTAKSHAQLNHTNLQLWEHSEALLAEFTLCVVCSQGVSVADCVRAAEVCTRLTAGTPCQALLPWLQFCFDVLSVSAESVLSGRGGVTDEGAGSSVLALLRCLLHTLTVAHLRKQAKPPPKVSVGPQEIH